MSAANGTQRDIGLDLTRILAFLAVPSVHFFLNSTYYDTAIVGPRMALMTVMRTAFMVCVPLYMLLSGYLSAGKHIPLTRSGLLGYYKKPATSCTCRPSGWPIPCGINGPVRSFSTIASSLMSVTNWCLRNSFAIR